MQNTLIIFAIVLLVFGRVNSQQLQRHQVLPNGAINNDTSSELCEQRFFLASNFDHLNDDGSFPKERANHTLASDLFFNWTNKLGRPTKVGSINSFEWKVQRNETLIDGDFLLKNLQYNESTFKGSTIWKYTPKIYCDFIYSIDANDWLFRTSGTDESTSLFVAEYYLQYKDNAGTTHWHTVINDSNDDISFSTFSNSTYPANEPADTKLFPNGGRFQPGNSIITPRKYSVQRKIIDFIVDTIWEGTPVKYNVDRIECKLRAYHPNGDNRSRVSIFVRGTRIRTDLAEQILSGSLHGAMNEIFDNKKRPSN
jgi:hypothetical protein